MARDGTTSAVIRSSFAQPYEVWAGPVGAWKQVTRANQSAQPMWGEAQEPALVKRRPARAGLAALSAEFRSRTRKYPLVVVVHGGPACACLPTWPGWPFEAPLASQGYFVLCPNPRGSYGEGEAFTQANVKDFGDGDFRDIMAGVDEVLKQVPGGPAARGPDRLELRRLHDHVGRDADPSFSRRDGRRRRFQLAELLRRERH